MTDVRTCIRLTEALAGIGRWYAATADPPRDGTSTTHTAPTSTPPLAAAVLSLRRDTADKLASWALLVAEERDLRPSIDSGDVPALVAFLSAHAQWLAGHEAGEDAAAELDRLAIGLEEVVRQSRPARVTVGACPEPECEGTLTAVVRRSDTLLPSVVRCDSGKRDHSWSPHDWPALGRRLQRAMDQDTVHLLLGKIAG